MPGRTRRRFWSVIALTLLIALQTALPCWAWGPIGHRVIARLAERSMTPAAKAGVAALLEPGESLADASVWPDEHRRDLPRTAQWHYVGVPLDEPRYDARFSGDVPEKGCVVDKINEFRTVVRDKRKPVEERRARTPFPDPLSSRTSTCRCTWAATAIRVATRCRFSSSTRVRICTAYGIPT